MNNGIFPSDTDIKKLRSIFTAGTIVEIINIRDKWTNLKPGDRGTVQFVDDAGQIHVIWYNLSSLALIPGIDEYSIVSTSKSELNSSD